jgi:hypothetical protein
MKFINHVIGKSVMDVGHDLQSCTSEIEHAIVPHPNDPSRRIVFIDTPGIDLESPAFDDTPEIPQPNRKERRKTEKLNRVARARSRQARDGGLPKVRHAFECTPKSCTLIFITAKKYQQVDARGSTINNVGGDQINIVVNSPTSPHIEEVDQDITMPVNISSSFTYNVLILVFSSKENYDTDPELNKYPPLVEFGLKVVMSTTKLVMRNINAAAACIAEIPHELESNIQSITLKRWVKQLRLRALLRHSAHLILLRLRNSFRYSFFSDEDVQPCSSPIAACPTCSYVFP